MKRIASPLLTFLMVACLLVGSERRAWGYVDPGTGLIALQTFASVAAAYAYLVRRKIRAFFARKEAKPVRVAMAGETARTREAA